MDSGVKEAIGAAVDDMKEGMIDTLQALVRIPSVVGNEGSTQAFMRNEFEGLNLDVHAVEVCRERVKDHHAFLDSGLSNERRPNMIGILKGAPQRKSIILNGHVDVMSPEQVDQWTRDPSDGEVEGNRLYGRGAWDMMAGLVANLYALRALERIGKRPKGTVVFQTVIEGEAGRGGGTLACFLESYTGDS